MKYIFRRCAVQLLLFLFYILISLSSGCKTAHSRAISKDQEDIPSDVNTNGRPAIFYIGERAILTFETNRPFVIAINGLDLFQDKQAWSVKVEGTVPALPDLDYELRTIANTTNDPLVSPGNAVIYFKPNYTARLRDKFQITVNADILQPDYRNIREALQNVVDAESLATNETNFSTLIDFKPNISILCDLLTLAKNSLPVSFTKSAQSFKAAQSFIPATLTNQTELTEAWTKQLPKLKKALRQSREIIASESFLRSSFPVVASGTRAFQLYTVDYYSSNFLDTRLNLNEIKAFPLPDAQVKEIFGNKVLQHFYVVCLYCSK